LATPRVPGALAVAVPALSSPRRHPLAALLATRQRRLVSDTRPPRLSWMAQVLAMPRHPRSAHRPRRSRPRRPCCARRARPVQTTARRPRATRRHRPRRRDTTRLRLRLSSTRPRRPATRLLAPTTAPRRQTFTERGPRLLRTRRRLPPGRQRRPRTRPRAQASRRALGTSCLPRAPATPRHLLLSLLEHPGLGLLALASLVRGRLATNTRLPRRLTIKPTTPFLMHEDTGCRLFHFFH
jgi:hypothetical protein